MSGSGGAASGGEAIEAGAPSVGGAPSEAGAGQGGEPGIGEGGASAGAPSVGGAPPDDGSVVWGRRFGDALTTQFPRAIAVEPDGDFTLTGSFAGEIDFGQGPLGGDFGLSMFLAKFDTGAAPIWSKSYGDFAASVFPSSLDVGSDGAWSPRAPFSASSISAAAC